LFEFKKNVLAGGQRIVQSKLNDFVKDGGSGSDTIKGPRKLNNDLFKGFAALEANKPKSNNTALGIDNYMDDIASETEDMTDEQRKLYMDIEINRYLKNKDPNFNYRVVSSEFSNWPIFSPGYSRGKKWTILAAPGSEFQLNIGTDYKPVWVFQDIYDGREMYYTLTEDAQYWGRLLGTKEEAINQLRFVAKTMKEAKGNKQTPVEQVHKWRVGMPKKGKFTVQDMLDIQGD
jgi:hypothetical protein